MTHIVWSKQKNQSAAWWQHAAQSGFTLIEIMVAMALATIVMLFIFNIQIRMTQAYTMETRISDAQHDLSAMQSMVDRDIRQAGYMLSQGFRTNLPVGGTGTINPNALYKPIYISNAANGATNGATANIGDDKDADSVFAYYGDPSRLGTIKNESDGCDNGTRWTYTPQPGLAFRYAVGEAVLISNPVFDGDADPLTAPNVVYEACVGMVTADADIGGGQRRVTLSGEGDGSIIAACGQVCSRHKTEAPAGAGISDTVVMPFKAVGYQIGCEGGVCPANGTEESKLIYGLLQRWDMGRFCMGAQASTNRCCPSGGCGTRAPQDIALGFVDLQLRYTSSQYNAMTPNVRTIFTNNAMQDPTEVMREFVTNMGPLANGAAITATTNIVDITKAGDRSVRQIGITLTAQTKKTQLLEDLPLRPVFDRGILTSSTRPATSPFYPSNRRSVRAVEWTADTRNTTVGYE